MMYQYILKNKDELSFDKKIEIALKYQFLIEGTSLFPEIELSEKTTSPIVYKLSEFEIESKRKLLDNQRDELYNHIDNLDKIINNLQKEAKIKLSNGDRDKAKKIIIKKQVYLKQIKYLEFELSYLEYYSDILTPNEKMAVIFEELKKQTSHFGQTYMNTWIYEEYESIKEDSENEENEFFSDENEDDIEEQLKELENEINEENEIKDYNEKIKEKNIKLDLNEKENVIEIIKSQNFEEGFWDINEKTMNIKNKYENEFNKLKQMYYLNIDDIIAMTIIVLYFIYNEQKELIDELVMFIKKAKLYIKNKTGDNYDNIIKKVI